MRTSEPLELTLSLKAQSDLEEIWLYSAQVWGRDQADLYLNTLQSVFETLCDLPELAREYEELSPAVRMHQTGQHVVIYRVQGSQLQIIRVLGARQNWRAVLAALDA
ncbi:type II toxin-antitoxin system RelE/ParE family toxin [Phaeobacter inhibens]|uniref:type II toxin-antitoxin system RelE/ParE family toxin n=1 Tax=Phaeobacter inhibens TaxID=221822 RepID=UPI0021A5041D|nr:type II toxin-antitoxin system RelE/ParE family toxin [Phaeobacter inhibens]UWR87820.1 type II toxin-antitoxin system RelE/ParE family toxin [Phaeobacter inhibens]